MHTHISNLIHRPFLLAAFLLSTLSLSACLSPACNLVGPSESVGSHGEAFDIVVRVTYNDKGATSAVQAVVTESRGGTTATVEAKGSEFLTIRGIQKGQSVTFTAVTAGRTGGTPCTWNGRVGVVFDGGVLVTDDGLSNFPPVVECVGW